VIAKIINIFVLRGALQIHRIGPTRAVSRGRAFDPGIPFGSPDFQDIGEMFAPTLRALNDVDVTKSSRFVQGGLNSGPAHAG
jgi:hypothetical protein